MSRRAALAAALAITGAVIIVGIAVDYRNTSNFREQLRHTTERVSTLLGVRMAARLQTDLDTTDNLAHAFVTDKGANADLFRADAARYLDRNEHFAGIVTAPDFELDRVFIRSSEQVAGNVVLRGNGTATLAEAIRAYRDIEKPVVLTSDRSRAVVLLMPVANPGGADGKWGAIAVVIDKLYLFDSAGISLLPRKPDAKPMIDLSWLKVAIRDVTRPDNATFFGTSMDEPLSHTIDVADGQWELQAMPKAGWNGIPDNQAAFRLQLLLAGLAMIIPVFIASLLIGERNRNIAALRLREGTLMQLSQRFALAMEASSMGVWEFTDEMFWDARASSLHGATASDGDNRLEEWLAAIHPEDRPSVEAYFFACACVNVASSVNYRVMTADGSLRHLRSAGAAYRNPDGSQRVAGIVWDVSADMTLNQSLRAAKEDSDIKNAELELALDELYSREQQLEELTAKLGMALESYRCGIWESLPDSRIEHWDARLYQLHGLPYSERNVTAEQWIETIHPEDRAEARRISAHFGKGSDEPLVVRVPQPDGSIRYVRSVGKLHIGRDGRRKVIGLAFDVTDDAILTEQLRAAKQEADAKNIELQMAKNRIEHNSLHDPLTMLANRRSLDLALDELSRASESERQKLSILHLDLDRFKQINDTLGHAAGDAMLVHTARILLRSVNPGDLVARIGGDEFVILVKDDCSTAHTAALSNRIIAEIRQPVEFEGFSCRFGVSIGIAQATGRNIDARRMLVNADIALYRAKAQGRNRFEFFTQNLQAEIISHKRTADEVLAGIENDEFVAWYQPQFDARTMKLTGAEALVRWKHPQHGILAPDRFLKIADELNVTATLDQIVLQSVLKDKMRWAALGLDVPKVSVNVSSRRLHDDALIDTLKTLAITPGQISFELVESIFLDESEDAATSNLERIKALGIDIEIDDFGTGHTSIVSLLKLKPKRLKIDRQLVMPILNSPQERTLVRSIIDIARSLGVETVAEGVESMAHAAMLRELGCDLLQGYAFARPLPFDAFNEAAARGWNLVDKQANGTAA
ncbi:EAL domain-containing protein [Rhizobiales bacterium RZME27]|uniref:EAL domain-containing protein n=1 Tax=Endobacterium cereale TaxID=2663029 RepID=A0A6A8ACG6_9HYPH|nr:EAL domain-containing protein [Endobacterium cereale]MEB2846993.1 EAL domain-containing protein [Endobacterium cereale]MQY47588.1 EAL domain-containing protein [Endobacterium cereale]